MRIYSMTATFGKLENKTLTLKPGLNVISAPNEWGKSTWCAFLVAMLYGIDTRERNTQTSLADKEHYKPWSGSPMSGRMDISWKGRDITIERGTKGRMIMGEFRAYETATGLPVPELTASNCGEMLLGVEKTVFVRSGFIRMADMPVTNDESLRRRLNALVTTGDESGASDDLAQKLKELKNRCRHNRTGALPVAESQKAELMEKLRQLDQLQEQVESIRQRQTQLQQQIRDLENHKAALAYAAEEENLLRIRAAQQTRDQAKKQLREVEAYCQTLPEEQVARETSQQLQQQWNVLQTEQPPVMPEPVQVPTPFTGMDGEQAVVVAKSDYSALQMLQKPLSPVLPICAAISAVAGIVLTFLAWFAGIPFLLMAGLFLFLQYNNKKKQTRDAEAVCARYGTLRPEFWVPVAEKYNSDTQSYAQSYAVYKQQTQAQQSRREDLTQKTFALTQGQPLAAAITSWENILVSHSRLQEAQRAYDQANNHATALEAMAKQVDPPAYPDLLLLTPEQTQQDWANATADLSNLERRLGHCLGQMGTLGSRDVLEQQLAALEQRIARLEEIYQAVTLAQETLTQAADTLQRRFAPKLTAAARDLFGKLTGGRYDRLLLGQDLSVSTGAEGETTLHSAQWRSDGTADQLYLALRLAVANELIPEAPLVLDDALVRFDEARLESALDILIQQAESKQVILFTCQAREDAYLAGKEI